ncbi:MAG: hypothetical protein K6T90_17735 [Leptolyngbyaceae cyanobacterium HOT.MB2.61]|jgi:hypothetical protein|nr:hypothetical protein [Leptolyngbyaceae cyanobacterium HOT.MB2.61]
MNITPYLIAIIGLALLVHEEYALAAAMIVVALGEILLPNLNTMSGNHAFMARLGITAIIVSLLVYRLFRA